MSWICNEGPNKGNPHCHCQIDLGHPVQCCFCMEKISKKYNPSTQSMAMWSEELEPAPTPHAPTSYWTIDESAPVDPNELINWARNLTPRPGQFVSFDAETTIPIAGGGSARVAWQPYTGPQADFYFNPPKGKGKGTKVEEPAYQTDDDGAEENLDL